MRRVLAGLSAWSMLTVLVPFPQAMAEPETCPPVCDRIPAQAWPDPRSLPLDEVYDWPVLAALAAPVAAPRFRFEELCATPPPPDDPRAYAVAARTLLGQPGHQWQLRAQIVHWRGETWRGGQLALSVLDAALAALRSCQVRAPQFSPSITTSGPDRFAAVISGPVIVHQYLLVDPRSSTISELSFSVVGDADSPAVSWPTMADAEVFDAMAPRLCAAYLGSCE